jgi:adenosylmethionine-8-amino-7-oxononanoate aminotransferase
MKTLSQRDQAVLWHPFTQHGLEAEFLAVKSGSGAWLTLENGDKILDAISSWWVNIHGHAHPQMAAAIAAQAQKLEHVIFAGFTHEPAIQLAETLIKDVQSKGTQLSRCFLSDSGSTAVEAALKMAYQYHKNKGIKNRTRFIALENSYHGDTLGSMNVSSRGRYHLHYKELLADVDFVPTDNIDALKNLLDKYPQQHAAIIFEPLVQAAGGMVFYSADYLKKAVELCKQAGILLICDEIFTNFYRTGTCFAFEQVNIQPDILCLGKGLTGGYLTLSALLATDEIYESFIGNEMAQAFWHSSSYTGNPIACATALASWELLQSSETQVTIQNIGQRTQFWIEQLKEHPNVENARHLGTLGAVNIKKIPSYYSSQVYGMRAKALQNKVLLRPMGPVLYCLPPYCVTMAELDHIYETFYKLLDHE